MADLVVWVKLPGTLREPGPRGRLWRLSESDEDERLLWTTGMGRLIWDWRSGVPSRLGRAGGAPLGDVTAGVAVWALVVMAGGMGLLAVDEAMIGRAGSRADLEGDDSCTSRGESLGGESLNFVDDFLGGGLGGGAAPSLLFFFFSLPASLLATVAVVVATGAAFLLSPSRTVELDDDELSASLTAARPWGSALIESTSFGTLPALLRVRGGRELCWWRAGLFCLTRGAGRRKGATRPGECDEIEVVGVVSRL